MDIAIIGGGPAGLYAAEIAAAGGASVTLYDAKASVGRKFLVAGKGGLNLTHAEARGGFARRYTGGGETEDFWEGLITDFDAEALRAWATGLGVETFAASTGRIYPEGLKAAPLLRRWVERLRGLGVEFCMHHRWVGLTPGAPVQIRFQHHEQEVTVTADAVILALGGGSWPETGSDGAWTGIFDRLGIGVAALQAANCGWEFSWPASVLAKAEGKPLKNISVEADGRAVEGELLITHYGIEGGALYQLGAVLRTMAEPVLCVDFKPAFSVEQLIAKMNGVSGNFLEEARGRWKLSDAAHAILETGGGFGSIESLAVAVKNWHMRLAGPRPIAEAISSAGGVLWSELDGGLMLKKIPGVFVAGEMIDWEAPTGGYLIHGCFATGRRASHGALDWLKKSGLR
ncbi:MAG: TIGR03862 family flavoprotein [Chthoniobacteraceae bacterium]